MKEVAPIIIENNETGKKYTLQYNRASQKRAARMGFKVTDIQDDPYAIEDLFYHAFYMHHGNSVSKDDTNHILYDELGGMSEAMLDRLAELWAVCLEDLYQTEDKAKNSKWSVSL